MKKNYETAINWVDTATAATELGFSIKHLLSLRARNFLKPGQHWRDIRSPGAGRATYRWNVEACGAALAVPAEKRD
jgi:hypothetical protein